MMLLVLLWVLDVSVNNELYQEHRRNEAVEKRGISYVKARGLQQIYKTNPEGKVLYF